MERHLASDCARIDSNDQSSTMNSFTPNNPASTLYIPIASPPTPAPSPGPCMTEYPILTQSIAQYLTHDPARLSRQEFANLAPLNPSVRREYLAALLGDCTPSELLFISITIAPLLKRDFLRELPPELALHILSFIDDPQTLVRATQVSKHWRGLLADESLWRRVCEKFQFETNQAEAAVRARRQAAYDDDHEPLKEMEHFAMLPMDPAMEWLIAVRKRQVRREARSSVTRGKEPASSSRQDPNDHHFSYREYFKSSYSTMMNWRNGGHLLRTHRTIITSPENGVATSVALDADWVVVGLSNTKIHVFSAKTGVLSRTLIGHELGVWAVNLISRGGFLDENRNDYYGDGAMDDLELGLNGMSLCEDGNSQKSDHRTYGNGLGSGTRCGMGKKSDVCCASEGWGQPNALVVSGGCDKVLRVWDVKSGRCIFVLQGHTSTIRCIKVLHNRPIAVTGSRDATLRVWDVQRGIQLRILLGHQQSVRCLDICGNRAVSGSYDTTCRLWNIDTGECLHVLRGHFHQIYSVAFDGVRIASGGLDTTVRVWDAATGKCVALLQGHTALVCQLQLSPTILATGGSDGRVITFCLSTFTPLHKIAAHDSSVTSLQFDSRFLVTGGNDGRVRLFETATGNYIRELSERSESVWKVAYRGDVCAIMCKRAVKTCMEIWSFRSKEDRGTRVPMV